MGLHLVDVFRLQHYKLLVLSLTASAVEYNQQFFNHVETGLPVLNQYLAVDKVSCSMIQRSASDEARTCKPLISSLCVEYSSDYSEYLVST